MPTAADAATPGTSDRYTPSSPSRFTNPPVGSPSSDVKLPSTTSYPPSATSSMLNSPGGSSGTGDSSAAGNYRSSMTPSPVATTPAKPTLSGDRSGPPMNSYVPTSPSPYASSPSASPSQGDRSGPTLSGQTPASRVDDTTRYSTPYVPPATSPAGGTPTGLSPSQPPAPTPPSSTQAGSGVPTLKNTDE
jgi:hypothetical protein